MKLISECTLDELREELAWYYRLSHADQIQNKRKYTILIDELNRRGVYDPIIETHLPFDEPARPGFWVTVDKTPVHVQGDPNMSDAEFNLLEKLVRAAIKQLDTDNPASQS